MREPCMDAPYKPAHSTVPTLVTEGCPEGLRCVSAEDFADVISEVARMGRTLRQLWRDCGELDQNNAASDAGAKE